MSNEKVKLLAELLAAAILRLAWARVPKIAK